jgi:outer membrane protein assembly factor BamB
VKMMGPKSRWIAGAATLALSLAVLAAGRAAQAPAAEWPQWRGPDRTGVSRETGLQQQWSEGGPRLLWSVNGAGGGYSTPSVAGGRIYGMGYHNDEEVVWARNAETGQSLWSVPIAEANPHVGYGDGSRSTPTVVGDHLFVVGVSGDVVCLRTEDGALAWRRNLVSEFGGQIPNWGYSESPLVDGDRVIVTPGGRRATLVALNRRDGSEIWRSAVPGGDPAHYSSAIQADLGGGKQYIQFLSGGVVGVTADEGRFLWRYESPANGTANISTPIFSNGHIFAASAYNTGGGLARLIPGGNAFRVEEVYFTRDMRNHHGGMVLLGDHLYGFDESNLTCIEFRTGRTVWSNRSVGKGSVVFADGHLYARGERGPVALVEANPNQYVEKGRFDQPQRSGKNAWPHPVVVGGKLYLRDQDVLLCYDVSSR